MPGVRSGLLGSSVEVIGLRSSKFSDGFGLRETGFADSGGVLGFWACRGLGGGGGGLRSRGFGVWNAERFGFGGFRFPQN